MKRMYAVAVTVLLVLTVAVYLTGRVTISTPAAAAYAAGSLCLIGLGLVISRHERAAWVGEAAQAFGACAVPVLLTLVAQAAITPWTWDPADAWLSAPERALGLTHPVAHGWAVQVSALGLLGLVYGSIGAQLRVTWAYWSLWRLDTRPLWEVATGFALCGFVALPLYVVAPAEGPWAFYGEAGPMPSWLIDWHAMRAGPHEIRHLDGYIGSPSYHAIFAVLLTYAWWATPLRAVVLAVNTTMIAATWVVGHHYLADIAVGGVIAVLALICVRRAC